MKQKNNRPKAVWSFSFDTHSSRLKCEQRKLLLAYMYLILGSNKACYSDCFLSRRLNLRLPLIKCSASRLVPLSLSSSTTLVVATDPTQVWSSTFDSFSSCFIFGRAVSCLYSVTDLLSVSAVGQCMKNEDSNKMLKISASAILVHTCIGKRLCFLGQLTSNNYHSVRELVLE